MKKTIGRVVGPLGFLLVAFALLTYLFITHDLSLAHYISEMSVILYRGAVAEVVGKLLRELGERHQVLCVTHLPQVAACGNAQYRVSKTETAGTTRSRIDELDAGQRVEEIARMLGGIKITATTREHAREMLGVLAD